MYVTQVCLTTLSGTSTAYSQNSVSNKYEILVPSLSKIFVAPKCLYFDGPTLNQTVFLWKVPEVTLSIEPIFTQR